MQVEMIVVWSRGISHVFYHLGILRVCRRRMTMTAAPIEIKPTHTAKVITVTEVGDINEEFFTFTVVLPSMFSAACSAMWLLMFLF
jgi:hypothetical protein